ELDALRVSDLERAGPCEDDAEAQHDEPEYHVRGMKAHERIERRPEKVRADREALLDDEAMPFPCGASQDREPEHHGDEQPPAGAWSPGARSRSCTRAAGRSWPIRGSRLPTGCLRPACHGAMSTRR